VYSNIQLKKAALLFVSLSRFGFMLIWFRRQGWRHYGLPVTSVAIAVALRLLLTPFMTDDSPFMLFFAAVMISSYYGPRGAGMLAAVLAAIASDYFFIPPHNQFAIKNVADGLEIGLFVAESAVISIGITTLKSSRKKLQLSQLKISQQQEMLQQTNIQLEQQVQDRTQKLAETNAALGKSLIQYKQSELALIESERRLELALESSGDGWWDWDIPAGTVNLSALWLEMLGYEVGELPGNLSTWQKLTHPEDFPWVMETLQAHLKDPTATLYRFDYRVSNKLGEWRWIANYGKVIDWDTQGNPTRMVGMHRDVNDRKVAEQELLRNEYTLRSFFNNASMMMGISEIIEDDVRLISVNRATAEFLSSTPEEIQNRLASQIGVPSEIVQIWIDSVCQSDRTGSSAQFEHEFHTPNGFVWLSATVSPIQSTSQERLRFSFIVEDITSRKQIEDNITASLQEKEVLLKEVHHRVKNNLQVICSLLNLQARSTEDPLLVEQLKESRNRVKSMALVHEKLYQSESLSKIDLHEYLQDLTKHLLRSHDRRFSEISLKIDISREILLDIDVAIPCGLIINELVSNAFKHAFGPNCSGEVYIQGYLGIDGGLVLIVQDTGRGLPSSWSLAKNQTLGLELVKDLTEQLKAKIEIESLIGTRFKINFPVKNN
jgi:PAS domain S-box-containing protein